MRIAGFRLKLLDHFIWNEYYILILLMYNDNVQKQFY